MPSLDSAASASALSGSDALRRLYSAYARCLEFGDLAWLKRAGKRIAVTFQGDDARQGAYCREHFDISPTPHVPSDYYTAEKDARRRSIIERFDRYADLIFALNPDLLHVLPERAQFLPYTHIDIEDWKPRVSASSDTLVIAHAPTHEGVKGTPFVTRAVEKLREQGLQFEFRLLRGLSHAEVRDALATCDVLVDQLLLGWYGGIAVEAMALGIPVVCYLREDDLHKISPHMRKEIPIVRATPTDIGEILERCVRLGAEPLREIGKKSREYVEKWHDPLAVARMVSEQYESTLHL
ncbi:MAG: glycosyltransferase family 1 protein [Myxococcales bacterium]|nr:glycosyltransferase family 1 protein [Myxococcales bacterium]